MLEELQRRNYSQETTRSYIHAVKQFAEYFGKSPQELGAEEIRRYQLYLLNEKKYSAGTVKVHMAVHLYWGRLQPLPIAKPNGPSMTSDGDTGQLIESHAI